MREIKNLYHLSIQVNDFDKTIDFYRDRLGFEQMFLLTIGDFKNMLQMGEPAANDADPWLTYLRIAPEQYLEIFNGAINPPEFVKNPVQEYADSAFVDYTLKTGSLPDTALGLAKKGLSLVQNAEDPGSVLTADDIRNNSIRTAWLIDPDNNKIKIIETDASDTLEVFEREHPLYGEIPEPRASRLFQSLRQVTFRTRSLEDSLRFYENLGMERVQALTLGEWCAQQGKVCPAGVREDTTWAVVLRIAREQYLGLVQAAPDETVSRYDDDKIGHYALQVHDIPYTVRTWAQRGERACYHPFDPDHLVDLADTKGSIGLDRDEIVWIIDPDGNRVEVMAQHGDTMQQDFERTHPY